MSKLVFKGDESHVYEASINIVGPEVISLVFVSEKPSNDLLVTGFNVINEHNGVKQGDYTAYKTIFRDHTDETILEVLLSKDGSTYVPTPITPYEPTVYPVPTLAETIAEKKQALAQACRTSIENGVTISVNEVDEKFSYSLDGGDQTNIDDIFNTMIQTGLPQYYHCDGGPCKLYSPEDIFMLYAKQKENKLFHTTLYNQLCQILKDRYEPLEDTIENRARVSRLGYGAPEDVLDGKYLEAFNTIIADGEQLMIVLRQKLEAVLASNTTQS